MSDLGLYLVHIIESIGDIQEFTREGRAAFMASKQTQAAVKYALQTLAESTQRLPDDLKARYPHIDWTAIAGLRNRLVHDYLGIELTVLWEIVENDLEPLRDVVEAMQRNLDASDTNAPGEDT
jgi:uncharacterized protein with HEPN domain